MSNEIETTDDFAIQSDVVGGWGKTIAIICRRKIREWGLRNQGEKIKIIANQIMLIIPESVEIDDLTRTEIDHFLSLVELSRKRKEKESGQ